MQDFLYAFETAQHYDPDTWEWGNKYRTHERYALIGLGCLALSLALSLGACFAADGRGDGKEGRPSAPGAPSDSACGDRPAGQRFTSGVRRA